MKNQLTIILLLSISINILSQNSQCEFHTEDELLIMIKKETDKYENSTQIIVYIVLSEVFYHIYSQSFIEMIEKESRIRLFCTNFNKNDNDYDEKHDFVGMLIIKEGEKSISILKYDDISLLFDAVIRQFNELTNIFLQANEKIFKTTKPNQFFIQLKKSNDFTLHQSKGLRLMISFLLLVITSLCVFMLVKSTIEWATNGKAELNRMKDNKNNLLVDKINDRFNYIRRVE